MTELLSNPYTHKDMKSHCLEVMNRLLLADMLTRFGFNQRSKNPYFNEATKYCQLYVEIFQKMVRYHTKQKLEVH